MTRAWPRTRRSCRCRLQSREVDGRFRWRRRSHSTPRESGAQPCSSAQAAQPRTTPSISARGSFSTCGSATTSRAGDRPGHDVRSSRDAARCRRRRAFCCARASGSARACRATHAVPPSCRRSRAGRRRTREPRLRRVRLDRRCDETVSRARSVSFSARRTRTSARSITCTRSSSTSSTFADSIMERIERLDHGRHARPGPNRGVPRRRARPGRRGHRLRPSSPRRGRSRQASTIAVSMSVRRLRSSYTRSTGRVSL